VASPAGTVPVGPTAAGDASGSVTTRTCGVMEEPRWAVVHCSALSQNHRHKDGLHNDRWRGCNARGAGQRTTRGKGQAQQHYQALLQDDLLIEADFGRG
jgi:hypothetical protein